ncbi:MMPL family transporter [Streptomyces xanthophaeus]|uniref:MMPL family transporter n=1 Tax=Streptomyces xanthophaeus TaxID=67385 RepID=UPI00068DA996|nr:MMPL family transporter [Streptomyces xanthophaeus]
MLHDTLPSGTASPVGDQPARGARHWSSSRPWRVLGAAAIFTAVCIAVGALSSANFSTGGFTPAGTESARVERALAERFAHYPADLIVHVPGDADAPSVAAQGRALTQKIALEPGVAHAVSYWTTGATQMRAKDGRAALIAIDLAGNDRRSADTAARLVPKLPTLGRPLTMSVTGPVWTSVQATEQSRTDLLRAELFAAPVTALILLLAFGSLTAAVLPAIIGTFTVAAAAAVLQLFTRVMTVSVFANNLIVALGFGLAVDYALFIVTRFREELQRETSLDQAIWVCMRTAGRSVLVSAATVAAALCSLLVFPLPYLRSVACAGITVVLLSALAAVTVLPALLTLLGNRIARAPNPGAMRRSRWRNRLPSPAPRTGSAWRSIAQAATRRPVLLGGSCAIVLITLLIPFGHVRFGIPDDRLLPTRTEAHATGDKVRADFPTPPDRLLAVLLPATEPLTHGRALTDYAQRLAAMPGVAAVEGANGSFTRASHTPTSDVHRRQFSSPRSTWLAITATDATGSDATDDLVRRVRHMPAPGPHLVGGVPAQRVDTLHALGKRLPAALAIGGLTTFVLLMLFARSLLIPLKVLTLAALSLTASLGAVVYVFQQGHLRDLVGEFTLTGQLDVAMPILIVVIAFGLSVDYEIFLLSRIKEEYVRTGDHSASIIHGITSTGRLVTAAALIMAIAMGAMATSGVLPLKILGFGLALAVLIDATLVRGILVPAFMQLTGKANWWSPISTPRRGARSAVDGRRTADIHGE